MGKKGKKGRKTIYQQYCFPLKSYDLEGNKNGLTYNDNVITAS